MCFLWKLFVSTKVIEKGFFHHKSQSFLLFSPSHKLLWRNNNFLDCSLHQEKIIITVILTVNLLWSLTGNHLLAFISSCAAALTKSTPGLF